jgi:hypothetical protein
VADDFTERYGALLTGSYDCVDRVVLNAFFPIGHNPGGFRCWWRRLYGSDDQLDDTHLMRMAGRFARRVKAWAAANGVPVIFCKAGERKHLIAERYLEEKIGLQAAFVHLLYNVFAIIVIYVIPVLRPVPLFCAETLARIAAERKWVVAVYLITVFIALPALVIILVGVL